MTSLLISYVVFLNAEVCCFRRSSFLSSDPTVCPGRRFIRKIDLKTLANTVVADNWFRVPFNSPNDVVVKRDGSIWFTDPSFGSVQGQSHAQPPTLMCALMDSCTTAGCLLRLEFTMEALKGFGISDGITVDIQGRVYTGTVDGVQGQSC